MTQVQAWQAGAPVSAGPSWWPGYNGVVEVGYRRGWVGLFSGENQRRAILRCLPAINAQGLGVAASVEDKWSLFARLWWGIVAVLTLGFFVKGPNVLLITYRLPTS